MKGLLAAVLLVLAGGAIPTETATASGMGVLGATEGVTVRGSDYRYIAISPRIPYAITAVGRIERRGGRLSRSWYLRGKFNVPAVAYDGSAGGLSADGRTLVLSRFSRTFPPRVSRFAILDTQRSFEWRRPGRPPRFRRFFDYVSLPGHFSFDAISPDGSTVYLIEHHLPPSSGPDYIVGYRVRALDVASGQLRAKPIVDAAKPQERMQGLPITRATSPDGRWAYTLYDGNGGEPFIHALDTVRARAVCVDLPQLEGGRDVFGLRLRIDRNGRRLTVMSAPPLPKHPPPLAEGRPISPPTPRPLLSVDTVSFAVTAATADTEPGEESGLAPAPIALAVLALAGATGWLVRRRRGGRRPGVR